MKLVVHIAVILLSFIKVLNLNTILLISSIDINKDF